VETGSPRMQKEVAKRLDLSLFWPTLRATRKAGMEATASFITGYPQETADDQAMTLDLIGSLWRWHPQKVKIQLHLLTPEPGTGMLSQFQANLAYDGHISDFNLPMLEPDDAEVIRDDVEIFVNYHYYLGTLPRRRHVLVTAVHPLLYRLGFAVQRHLLARYDRSLSRFFEDLLAWADRCHAQPPYSGDVLEAYMRATWGTQDYLTSLVRYMLTATDPARGCDGDHYRYLRDTTSAGPSIDNASSKEALFQLASRAAVLHRTHRCPDILAVLRAAEEPETAIVPMELQRISSSYVLLPGDGMRSIRNLAVTDDAVRLLTFLKRPRGRKAIARYLAIPERDARLLDEVLDRLLALGVLESAQPEERPDVSNSAGVAVAGV
jgi:hypothetical protein